MTTETATQEGVENEQKEQPNPRDAHVDEIAARVRAERDAEIKAHGGEPVDTAAREEAKQEEAKPEDVAAEAKPESADEKPAEPAIEMVTIKVDGELRQVPKEKIIDAGLRTLQKESTADKRLEDATRLLKELEQRLTPQQQNPAPSQVWDESVIAYALANGDDEQKAEAIRQIRGRQQEATPEQIARIAEARVLDTVDFRSSADWFLTEYKDVVSDPYLAQLSALREQQLRANGDTRPRRELYKAIGDELRAWRGGPSATSFKEKQEQKTNIVNLPSASVRKTAPETPKPKTASDIIETMRKARGQR